MVKNIPNFSFIQNRLQGAIQYCIECSGEFKHVIHDLDSFYLHMGYGVNQHANSILPDEYLWERFVKNSSTNNCKGCFQLRVIDYLSKHSKSFNEKFGAGFFGDGFIELMDSNVQQKYACSITSCPEKAY